MSVPTLFPVQSVSSDSPLVFLHIPKTAGTTLWLILRRQYSPRAVLRVDHPDALAAPPQSRPQQTRVLVGHFGYDPQGFTQPLPCITLLREPLERTLSDYSHQVRHGSTALSLGDYLNERTPERDNLQTRLLAGPDALALPFGQCGRDVFERAKQTLTEMAVAGLTERFDETLLLLQRRFGWSMPCYVAENVGADRVSRETVGRPALKRIWELTQWDRALYALAAARLDAQIAQQGPQFATALRQFRIANIRYRRLKAFVNSGPLQVLKSRLPPAQQMSLEAAARSVLRKTPLLHDHVSEPAFAAASETKTSHTFF